MTDHLYYEVDSVKPNRCDCEINKDHKDYINSQAYYVRDDVFSPWEFFVPYPKELIDSFSTTYAVYLTELEKDQIIALWEKSGVLSSVIPKIRAAENTKKV